MKKIILYFNLTVLVQILLSCQSEKPIISYKNSIGMEMVKIESGKFFMGSSETDGEWDEHPRHAVTISRPLYISKTEVTIEQFQKFKPGASGTESYHPYITGVSWYDAEAFCKWLSNKEGKPYRLPTESEWEYVCRAGTSSPFSTGDTPPDHETDNVWGVRNMHTGVLEWCYDWYGPYKKSAQIDPVGLENGLVRVIRGGLLDNLTKKYDHASEFYTRSANRAGLAPAFKFFANQPEITDVKAEKESSDDLIKDYPIGFRVVQASMPEMKPLPADIPFARQGIKQLTNNIKKGPDPSTPYFRLRSMLPIPLENSDRRTIDAAGFHPSFRGHNHSPALEVCSNGDVLLVIYTSYHEYEPGVSLIAARLRFGADQWDMPSQFVDFPDVNDHAPLLWNDRGKLILFWGNPRLNSAYPFQWTWSMDNGATFEEVHFPDFINHVGNHSRQPINSAFRDSKGAIYVASDGKGGRSVLWCSQDDGKTWFDSGDRSGGRHTTYVLLKNRNILGMGGKNTDIDGFMPKSISRDGGKTWEISKTPFPALGSNQRPTIIRLASGRLFFAGDFQRIDGAQPEGIKERGAFVALSEDEGETWLVKKLPGTRMHESQKRREAMRGETIGYSVARQAPNGLIHMITTMNHPCLHFTLNEAWILDKNKSEVSQDKLMQSSARTILKVNSYQEVFPDGKIRIKYYGGVADNGRFLLHGKEIWYYENGTIQYEVEYQLGKKIGREIYRSFDGKKQWEWIHRDNGNSIWKQWWANGKNKAESYWREGKCEGVAKRWDIDGKLISEVEFVKGAPVQ